MKVAELDVSQLAGLLRHSLTDLRVKETLGPLLAKIRRRGFYGFIELKRDGLDIVFNKAPWVIPKHEIVDPELLYVCAFHFHREGHEGYAGYRGKLPGGIELGDVEADILNKLDGPFAAGGGEVSSAPRRLPVPRWLKFHLNDAVLHLQLDGASRLEMVTIMTPDVRPST